MSTRARCWLDDAAGDHDILRSTRVQFLSVPRARQQPRPDLEIDLPEAAVLGRFIAGLPMRLAVSGGGVDIQLWFPAAPGRVGAARQMSAHCEPAPGR